MTKADMDIFRPEFREMIDNIPIGLYKSTTEKGFIGVNTFLINIFGFDNREDLLNINISDLYHSKKDREELILHIKKFNIVKNYEIRLRRKDGTPFWGSVTETAIKDESGKLDFFFGILEDITEKKAKENELAKLATLVNQAAVSIVLTDPEGKIQYVNPWFEKITGYSEDEVKGENPRILKSKNSKYPENYFESMWESINNGENWLGQFTNQKKSGEDYIEEATIFPVRSDTRKELLGFGAVKKDITKQIELERELGNSLREMEILKESAESASKLKSIFLANMSHDIRTPMNAIIGFSNLLKQQKLNEKLDGYVNNIIRSGNILLKLINDILDLSKIEAGQMDITQSTFFLNELSENIYSIFNAQFSKKKLNFRIKKGKNLPEKIHNDQFRIQQIIINFLSNSLKYTAKGEVSLKIGYIKGKDIIRFSVKDSGIGIPEEVQHKLFTPFFSNRTLHNIEEYSTGLGLAICKNLAGLLKGNIEMNSEFGIGSEFILEIPTNSSEVEDILQLTEEHFNFDNSSIIDIANTSILIAEDNPVNAELLYEALETQGFRNISIVSDGESAIETALEQLPQLIIMDNKMPKISGLKALQVIRKRGFSNPVIILTADAIEELQGKEISVMPESYLTKPINFELLFKEIHRVLNLDNVEEKKTETKKTRDIRSRLKINENISEKVKIVFLKDLRDKQKYLTGIIESGSIIKEAETLAIIAHTYKGNAGYFSLSPFESLAKELDSEFKNTNVSEKTVTELTNAINKMISDIIEINYSDTLD